MEAYNSFEDFLRFKQFQKNLVLVNDYSDLGSESDEATALRKYITDFVDTNPGPFSLNDIYRFVHRKHNKGFSMDDFMDHVVELYTVSFLTVDPDQYVIC